MSEKIPAGVIHDADNQLKRFVTMLRGVIALEEAVEKFGGLGQAIEEAGKRLAQLRSEDEALSAAIAGYKSELEPLRAELERVRAEHEQFLGKIGMRAK